MADRDNFLWKIYGESSGQGTNDQIMSKGGRGEGGEKVHRHMFQ